jgi:hypothetical protein
MTMRATRVSELWFTVNDNSNEIKKSLVKQTNKQTRKNRTVILFPFTVNDNSEKHFGRFP